MYQFSTISDRVKNLRARYRDTVPSIDTARYEIVTEFYKTHRNLRGILKRAYNFKNMCEKMPLRIEDDDLIVGVYTTEYHACALYPENSIDWLIKDLESRETMTRTVDPYRVSEETRQLVLETGPFWLDECMSAQLDPYIPDEWKRQAGNGCCVFGPQGQAAQPVGHFSTNYNKAIRKGFKAVQQEAEDKIAELLEKGCSGDEAEKLNFYRAVKACCEGIILFAKRYSAYAAELAADCTDPVRKAELERISSNLGWVIENPARDYYEAIQALWFYEMCVMMDANLHGTSIGRIDQYLGDYLEADLASGKLTHDQAQEITDMYYLKVAELNKVWSTAPTMSGPGYTSGQLFTLGGVDKDGNDATNAATYMCLESAARLVLHDPPQALRINRNTPAMLWDCAIECTKRAGGVPSFYSDDVVIASQIKRGLSLEDARNYCLNGCVEPSGCGCEWPACGGNGTESFMNLVNAVVLALNNGYQPMPDFGGNVSKLQYGPATGYLYEMKSMDEVKAAIEKQLTFWMRWTETLTNIFESVAVNVLPQPLVSSMMDGCMESGKDVMQGGAKYNGTGLAGVGIGNVADIMGVIDQVCFKEKKYTTRELYDAVMANWEGYDEMREYINNQCVRYGNDDYSVDQYAEWMSTLYAKIGNSFTGPRGRFKAGLYPVTMNVFFGFMTWATPDGRVAGSPLADGISAVQQMDTNGPTMELKSISHIPQVEYPNGTLLNMKFHPTALAEDSGKQKLIDLMNTYFFDMGGMQMQLNVVSADTMRAAQKDPDNYRDLVVRIAGFSAYFVDVFKEAQDDLIRRTEQSL